MSHVCPWPHLYHHPPGPSQWAVTTASSLASLFSLVPLFIYPTEHLCSPYKSSLSHSSPAHCLFYFPCSTYNASNYLHFFTYLSPSLPIPKGGAPSYFQRHLSAKDCLAQCNFLKSVVKKKTWLISNICPALVLCSAMTSHVRVCLFKQWTNHHPASPFISQQGAHLPCVCLGVGVAMNLGKE